MQEQIKTIQGLIEANTAIKERSPFLDVALGGLQTAKRNLEKHVEVMADKAKAPASPSK